MRPSDGKGKAAKSGFRKLTGAEFLARYRRHRFAWLFLSLLLTLAVAPALKTLVPGLDPLELLLAVTLVAAIASAARKSTRENSSDVSGSLRS